MIELFASGLRFNLRSAANRRAARLNLPFLPTTPTAADDMTSHEALVASQETMANPVVRLTENLYAVTPAATLLPPFQGYIESSPRTAVGLVAALEEDLREMFAILGNREQPMSMVPGQRAPLLPPQHR